ncbi:MAG: hypothetical protein ACRDYU_13595 [Actinomycetes bacterium]
MTETTRDGRLVVTVTEQAAPEVARPRPTPLPAGRIQGSRFRIYKQDPSVRRLGVRSVFCEGTILNGPRDVRITTQLAGTTPVPRNARADFIFNPGTPEFDCAHTWAVVRDTLSMYERLRGGTPIPWAWNTGGNTEAITVHPNAGETPNAYYSRSAKVLKFFHFTPDGATDPVHTCRSLDIVAHECGHAILDGLKPGWLSTSAPPQTGGLHEAFGDITAVFLTLSQLDQAEAVIAASKANLHAKTFLSAVAEEFGTGLGLPYGLRNADNDLKLSQVGNEVHAISQVFTGGIYDVLADIFAFEHHRQRETKGAALVLVEVASDLASLVLEAVIAAPASNATYADVVNKMLALSKKRKDPAVYRTYIRNRFTLREVVVSPAITRESTADLHLDDADWTMGKDETEMEAAESPTSLDLPQDRTLCCGTMQLPEFAVVAPDVLARGTSLGDEGLLAPDVDRLAKLFR